MPSEPNQKMDELLKAAAQKRRAEAGAPFEPHPATRNLLQAEVAKLRKDSPAPKTSWLKSLLAIWPRWAVGGALACALALTVFLRLQMSSQSSAERKLARISAREPERVEQLNRQSPTDRKLREVELAVAKQSSNASKIISLGRSMTDAKNANTNSEADLAAVAAPQSSLRSEAAVALSDSASALPNLGAKLDASSRADAAATNSSTRPLALALPALATANRYQSQSPNSQTTTRYGLILPNQANSPADGGNFAKRPEATENQRRESASAKSAPVASNPQAFLNSFTVEQTAGQLRVVDEDGSVYFGALVSHESDLPAAFAVNSLAQVQESKDELARDKRKSAAEARAQNQPAAEAARGLGVPAQTANQTYFFRVAGTNRSLNQLLVFNGNFVAPTNALAVNEKLGESSAPTSAANISTPFSRYFIQGQAQLGKDAPIEINATPVGR